MNEKQEKQFETKFTTAILGFALQFQSIMENANDEFAEKIVAKYQKNPEVSIDDMTKEIASHVVSELINEYDLGVKNYEAKS